MRKYYAEVGTVTHHQVLILKHLVAELLSTLLGKTSKHPGKELFWNAERNATTTSRDKHGISEIG